MIRSSDPSSPPPRVAHRTKSKNWEEIQELCVLCEEGKLYCVERWIANGRPIQCERPSQRPLRKHRTPLQIAAAKGFHSLAELLLQNGYDPNGDYYGCLALPVDARNASMVELLLEFGADPNSIDFERVLESYDRKIMDLFMAVGADPCAGNTVANALRRKAKPLLGFIKTYKDQCPGLQRQIDIALRQFADEEDEKGVALMLWLGANPHSFVPLSEWEENDEDLHECALVTAMWRQNENILRSMLKIPIPPNQATYLLRYAAHKPRPEVVRKMLDLGANPNAKNEGRHIMESFVCAVCHDWQSSVERDKRGLEAIRLLAAAGAKWDLEPKRLAYIRRRLVDGECDTVIGVIGILREFEVLSEEQLHELTRTDAIKRRLRGISRGRPNRFAFMQQSVPEYQPPAPTTTTRGYWKRHWSQR